MNRAKPLLVFLAAIVLYTWIITSMIHEHNTKVAQDNQFIIDHHCRLVDRIPAHPVGMMMQGEQDKYSCDDGKDYWF